MRQQNRGQLNGRSGFSRRFKVLAVAAAIIIASSGIYVAGIVLKHGHSALSVKVVNQLGQPIRHASVQGFMLLPPTVGAGYADVFNGVTDNAGMYYVSNTSDILHVSQSWIAYQGKALTSESSPNIVVFITYQSSNGIYFKQASVDLTATQLLAGVSFSVVSEINTNGRPETTPLQLSNAENATNAIGPAVPMSTVNNITSQPMKCSGNTCYDWFFVNSTFWPTSWSNFVQIPIIWMQVHGGAYGLFNAVIQRFSTNMEYNFNTGYAYMNTASNASSYDPGGSVWSSSLYYLSGVESVNSSSPNGSISIYGRLSGANFRLYYSSPQSNGWQPTSITQFDAAVVQVQNYSDGEIVHVRSQTSPPSWQYSGIMNGSHYSLYSQGDGNGETTPSFGVNSSSLVSSYTSNAASLWATIIIPVGALLAAVVAASLAPPSWLDVASAIAINVAASMFGSTTTSSNHILYMIFLNAQWDAPGGYTWSAYVTASNVRYDFSNISAQLPIMGLNVFASPSPA